MCLIWKCAVLRCRGVQCSLLCLLYLRLHDAPNQPYTCAGSDYMFLTCTCSPACRHCLHAVSPDASYIVCGETNSPSRGSVWSIFTG